MKAQRYILFLLVLFTASCAKRFGPYDSISEIRFYTNGNYYFEFQNGRQSGFVYSRTEYGAYHTILSNQLFSDGTALVKYRNDLGEVHIRQHDQVIGPCDHIWKWRYYEDGTFILDYDTPRVKEALYVQGETFGPYEYVSTWNYYCDSNYCIIYTDLDRSAYLRINGDQFGPYEFVRNVVYRSRECYYAGIQDASRQSGFIINGTMYGPYPEIIENPHFTANNHFYFIYADSDGKQFMVIDGDEYGPCLEVIIPVKKDDVYVFQYTDSEGLTVDVELADTDSPFIRLNSIDAMKTLLPVDRDSGLEPVTNGLYQIDTKDNGVGITVRKR